MADYPDDLLPEQRARRNIDRQLKAAGWVVQNKDAINLAAGPGIAVREFQTDNGPADYGLYVQRKFIGVIEAKKEGETLSQVEAQADKYAEGFRSRALREGLPFWQELPPFHYVSTGLETQFQSRLDPISRPRRVFGFYRPEGLLELFQQGSVRQGIVKLPAAADTGLRAPQFEALLALEASLRDGRPRALVQMATGAGKTILAISHAYRLLKWGQAKRILFLVDRRNLGLQARDEFRNWQTPDDGRKLGELYPVQYLTSNTVDPAAKVVITTIQRLYSMLRGQEEFDAENEDVSGWETGPSDDEVIPVSYQAKLPIETFDYIMIDECHRSIYGKWTAVLDYFDAHITGLTATPSKQAAGYFSNNVRGAIEPNMVSTYTYEQSVLDGYNVDYVVFRIKTRVGEEGGALEAGEWVQVREKRTRAIDLQELEDDFTYDENALDTAVVVRDQIRTVIRTFREALPVLFPGRTRVPKTVVFCKDDSHAEDVLEIIREEFGAEGSSAFAKKITYRSGNSDQAIRDFRNDPRFRIAVSVDQISTGTDIKPIECLLFMRKVKSKLLFEQMRGRGVRTVDEDTLKAVTPDAEAKTHFVLVDAVGITDDDHAFEISPPLDRDPTIPLKTLFNRLAQGASSDDLLTTLASRLQRLDKRLHDDQKAALAGATAGRSLTEIARALAAATRPEDIEAAARRIHAESGAERTEEVSAEDLAAAREQLVFAATEPLMSGDARAAIVAIQTVLNQVIDRQTTDEVVFAGIAGGHQARDIVESWEQFIAEHHDEYVALAAYYQQPAGHASALRRCQEAGLSHQLASAIADTRTSVGGLPASAGEQSSRERRA
jgi:type I restriction enzyme R subunit